MKDQNSDSGNRDMMLTSPPGVPFPFAVIIRGAWPFGNSIVSFEVKGNDPDTGSVTMWQYQLRNSEHSTYLDFFEQLSETFGLRVPQNRQHVPIPRFRVNYREVLTTNLAPGMLYGYGDPAVIRVEGESCVETNSYYLLATSNDAPDSFPILRSENLVDWEFVDYVFPKGKKPEWAAEGEGISDYWAPELHQIGNAFKVYFVARDKLSLELCIGSAKSSHPSGPFIADSEPIVKGNVIDPHIFVEGQDTAYLYWKEDNNELWPSLLLDFFYEHPNFISELFSEKEDLITTSFIVSLWPWARMLEPMGRFQAIQIFIEAVTSTYKHFYDALRGMAELQAPDMQERIRSILHYMKTPMFAQQLSADGLSLVGERKKIIENDLAWEAHLVEGMWVTKQGRKYYLFYAGNDFSTSQYGIGVAIADSPLGPFQKMEKQLLQSTEKWWAPGHPSLVTGPDGQPHLFLHAYFPREAGYKQFRALLSIQLIFLEDEVRLCAAR